MHGRFAQVARQAARWVAGMEVDFCLRMERTQRDRDGAYSIEEGDGDGLVGLWMAEIVPFRWLFCDTWPFW